MISALFKGLLNFILKLFELIMSPFVSAITSLFPDVGIAFSYINTFLTYALTYVSLVIDLLLIPRRCDSYAF